MSLSWNEIRHNAIRFAREWEGATSESADKQTFWNEFFAVFGIPRKTVASFEVPVLKTSGNFGKIDMLWKGVLLVEHKSAGEDLGEAKTQAFDYLQALGTEGRHRDVPRYVVVSDFARIVLRGLEEGTCLTFPLTDLHRHIHAFAFIPGYQQHKFKEEDPINAEAAELLGELHDALEAGGFSGHDLERFLVRILFCLFAEDTGLFPRRAFELYLEENAFEDMAKIGPSLQHLFHVLNTPEDQRQKNLSVELQQFPYVNGDLFAERLAWADFGDDGRQVLRKCCGFDWSRISPAIFGSLFQSVMEPKARRQIGAHYTSERDILKVIRSLFLDDLRAEFDGLKADRSSRRRARLEEFHAQLCRLRFLDPACGCGNFLVITYRELRALELEVLLELFGRQRELTLADVNRLSQVDVDQFYGIEIGEWPARIAEVALWLMDHQMNLQVSEAFGQLYQRLPLKKSPRIRCDNALRTDWKHFLPPAECSYVLGNPPFVGHHYQSAEQKGDHQLVLAAIEARGVLDYVSNWYVKAAEYIQGTRVRCAFVSTNSITQGEQAGLLWNHLFQHYRLKILFAHRTFSWMSEARGKAHVHVVIVGFGAFDAAPKPIHDYDSDSEKSTVSTVRNISPYLVEGADRAVSTRTDPICSVPKMSWGNKPTDGGHFILSPEERTELLAKEPQAAPFVRRYMSGGDFINGEERYCLWLKDADPSLLRRCPRVMARVELVRQSRLASKAESTRRYAAYPALFRQIAQPDSDYLAIPEVSSERRPYIPMAFLPSEVICSNKIQFVPNASLWHLGILTSAMHMAWMRQVCGRLESRYSYSNSLVYNNFPWPANISDKDRATVVAAAQAVLNARAKFPHATLADLYDPLSMKAELVKAHKALDRAVDRCYRPEPFPSDRARVEHLFALYERLTAPLIPAASKAKRTPRKQSASATAPAPYPTQPTLDATRHFHVMEDPGTYRTKPPESAE